ncbi:MAG TPA: transketolase C-terminal domain-containing protein [Candidatus Dojkabacteria bacterium]|jgi:transketolase
MNYLLENYKDEDSLEKKAIREGFGKGIVEAAKANEDIVVLNADLPGSLKLGDFEKEFPERYFQIGVAEQNMAGIGTGFATYGKIPFITSFAAFSPGLNFSQIRLAAMGHQNLKIIGSHYGLNTGPDGASAQMNADVAMMKALAGMTIISPADYNQAIQATKAVAEMEGPAYLRVTREKFPVIIDAKSEFKIGKAQKFMEGSDITVIATGSIVYESLQASEMSGASIDFLNIHTVKPLDEEAIIESAKKTGKVIVVEEHNIVGGLGESVARVLAENHPTKMKLIGVQDTFGESGSQKDLWKKYKLDREYIKSEIQNILK